MREEMRDLRIKLESREKAVSEKESRQKLRADSTPRVKRAHTIRDPSINKSNQYYEKISSQLSQINRNISSVAERKGISHSVERR